MMFLLNDIAIDFEFLGNGYIARILKVFQDAPSQQAQTEWVIAIWFASGFNLYTVALNALFVEERNCVRFLHSGQFGFAATL